MHSIRRNVIKGLIEILEGISDRSYQERVWIHGEGPEIDDFDETVCEFSSIIEIIDDEYKDYGLTDIQYQALTNFKSQFDAFSHGPALELCIPINFIDEPEWIRITENAKELLQILNIDEITPRINSEPFPN